MMAAAFRRRKPAGPVPPSLRLERPAGDSHIGFHPGAESGPVRNGRFDKDLEKMTRVSAFSSPLLLGFEEIERALGRLSRAASDGYPPYNIERLAKAGDRDETLRITLAVAGFTDEELDVAVEENQLVIRGKQKDEPAREYLHRGIAARQFQKTFVLAEGIEVRNAELKDGLLSIDLVRPETERVARRIAINGRG